MYKVVVIKLGIVISDIDKKLEQELNKIASEGWELITVFGDSLSVWKKI